MTSAGTSTHGVLLRGTHRLTMGDVDAAGIVYYANPYRWRDTMYTGWLMAVGHPLSQLLRSDVATPCVTSAARYLLPLRLDDLVELRLVVERVGRTSFDLRMDGIVSENDLAVQVSTRNVYAQRGADAQLAAAELPEWLRTAFAAARADTR